MRSPASPQFVVLVLWGALSAGCSGDRGAAAVVGSASAAASAQHEGRTILGRVEDPPEGALVMALEAPRGRDLLALGDAVIDLVSVDAQGGFRLEVAEGRGVERVLVSAPGRGLLSVSPQAAGVIRLAPQAVVTCRVLDVNGQPAEDALALVLDPDGFALPLPPLELVAGVDGVLSATRLPAGACELLISAVDAEQFAALRVRVDAGEALTREVRLEVDPALRRRFMRVAGVPEVPGLGQGGVQ